MTQFEPPFNDFENLESLDGLGEDHEASENNKEIELVTSSKIPWLQEISFTATKIMVLVVTLLVITLSIVAKVEWWIIILRAGVTTLILGFLGYLFNWILGKYLVEAKVAELKEKLEAEEAAEAERLAKEQAELEALEQLQQMENEENTLDIES